MVTSGRMAARASAVQLTLVLNITSALLRRRSIRTRSRAASSPASLFRSQRHGSRSRRAAHSTGTLEIRSDYAVSALTTKFSLLDHSLTVTTAQRSSGSV